MSKCSRFARWVLAFAVGFGGARAARGGEALPVDTLKKLKAATVMVQMKFKVPGFAKPVPAIGSGFLFRVDGDQGYVVISYYLIGLQTLLPEARAVSVDPTVVFFSGTPQEKVVKAEQVDNDQERHVAILRVSKFPNLPDPIPYDPKVELTETMPIFLLGFPFGKGLAQDKRNPNITISKGSISSLRNNDQGDLELIQIDGDFNPGQSGAPVVDAKGRLVGIAMGRLRGTRIGFAVPAGDLPGMMDGRITAMRVVTLKVDQGQADVQIMTWFRDPMEKTNKLRTYYVPASDGKDKPKPGPDGWTALPGAQKLDLEFKDGLFQGTLHLQSPKLGDKAYWFQTVLESKDGGLTYLAPRAFPVSFGRSLLAVKSFTPPKAMASKTPLKGKTRQTDDATVTEFPDTLGHCVLSPNGKHLFSLMEVKEKVVLRRIAVPEFIEERRLEFVARSAWLSQSAVGLVATLNDREEAWVIDPDTLAVKTRFHLPKLVRVIAHPSLAVGYAQKDRPNGSLDGLQLTSFDLHSGIVGKDYHRDDFSKPGLTAGLASPALGPAGKHLFTLGDNGQIHRYRVDGLFLAHEDASQPVSIMPEANITFSPDNRFLCVQSWAGNRGGLKGHPNVNGATFIYRVTNTSRPWATIADVKEIRALAFDSQQGRIFVSTLNAPLVALDATGKKTREIKLGDDAVIGRILLLPGEGRLVLLSHNRALLVELAREKAGG